MLDAGAYQRALAQRQGGGPEQQQWPPMPGQQFNQEPAPGFLFSPEQPPMQIPQGGAQEQMPPELMQFLVALLGQQNGPNPG